MNPAPVSDHTARTIRRVAEMVAGADALLITAGAGMSADSGLPVFRGNEGIWRAYPPLAAQRISFERMAQPVWFADRPRMAWAFYGHRLQLYREARPHPGYAILKQWAARAVRGGFVATSNVDGQFFKAGFAAGAVTERHGSIHRLQCQTPCTQDTWDAQLNDLDIDLDSLEARGELPRCRRCGGMARPNILMFSDGAWVNGVTRQQDRSFDAWMAGVRGQRLVVLEIGAGRAIPTIRRIGERAAERPRTTLVRINPEEREGDDGVIVLPLPALQALTMIEQAIHPPPVEAVRTRRRASSARVATEGAPELIRCVDLHNGGTCTVPPDMLSDAQVRFLIRHWQHASQGHYVAIPEVREIRLPGYTMRAQVVDPTQHPAAGTPGAGMLAIRDPLGRAVFSMGIARRPLEGAYLWRRMIEGATSPVQALEYPREPWIVWLPEKGIARNVAMLDSVCFVGYLMGVAWLREQERRERQGDNDEVR